MKFGLTHLRKKKIKKLAFKNNLSTMFLRGKHRLGKSNVTLGSISASVKSKRFGKRNLDYHHFVRSCHMYLLHKLLETVTLEVK